MRFGIHIHTWYDRYHCWRACRVGQYDLPLYQCYRSKSSLEIDLLEVKRENARLSLMLKLLSGHGYTYFIESFDKIQNNTHLGRVLHWITVLTRDFTRIVFILSRTSGNLLQFCTLVFDSYILMAFFYPSAA